MDKCDLLFMVCMLLIWVPVLIRIFIKDPTK